MLHLHEKCVGWLATCMGGHFNNLANTQKFVVNEDNDLSKIRDGHVRRGLVFSQSLVFLQFSWVCLCGQISIDPRESREVQKPFKIILR